MVARTWTESGSVEASTQPYGKVRASVSDRTSMADREFVRLVEIVELMVRELARMCLLFCLRVLYCSDPTCWFCMSIRPRAGTDNLSVLLPIQPFGKGIGHICRSRGLTGEAWILQACINCHSTYTTALVTRMLTTSMNTPGIHSRHCRRTSMSSPILPRTTMQSQIGGRRRGSRVVAVNC